MNNVGGALFEGNSKLFEGPLGVVQLGFKGYDLGKTTAACNLTSDHDVKDILFQQDGTKASDHVRTGQDLLISAVFGEIKTGLLVLLMSGMSSENKSALSDSGTFGRNVYQSMRDNEAGVLRVVAVDENGQPSANLQDKIQFYEAIPLVSGELINWGADVQRNLPVEFRIKYHVFGTGESSTKYGAYGYWGDPTTEDVPAVVWPDTQEPELLSVTVSTATDIAIKFKENIAFQSSFSAGDYIASVNGSYIVPASGIIATDTLTLTFPASSFSSGDIVEISIGPNALEDTATTPNDYSGVDAYLATNSL